VNAYLSVSVLIAFNGLLLTIPVIPAIVELYRKSDAQPLLVIQKHGGEIRHFSEGFRKYIDELKPTLKECRRSGATARGRLKDNAEYFVMGKPSATSLREVRKHDGDCSTVIVAGGDFETPGISNFSKEIYVQGNFQGGNFNHYRAILGEKDVELGAYSSVARWIHAVGVFSASYHCALSGRVSSDSAIKLKRKCTFLRLNAPRIQLGASSIELPQNDPAVPDSGKSSVALKRYLYDQDFEVQAGQIFHGNIVTRGKLRVHQGARIFGSLKSNKQMVLEKGVLVTGSVISASQLYIGPGCCIHGPIIAEHALHIDIGVRLGTPAKLATVSSPKILAKEGVVVFGSLWAREYGEVADKA